jgi:hypothetical protein
MAHRRLGAAISLAALAALLAAACSGGGGGDGGGPIEPPPPAGAGTFDRLQAELFDVSCATSSCHSDVARVAGLVLTGDAVWDALVGAAPSNAVAGGQGLLRVAPGDPDRSLLYRKLAKSVDAAMGVPMPWGGPYLDEPALEVVRAWIEAGAPRDGRAPGDDGRSLAVADGGDDAVALDPPQHGVQIQVTARAIPEGSEETACHYLKLDSDVDFDVDHIQMAVSGGSHHIHLYRPFDSDHRLPDGSEVCNTAVDFDVWELVAATQLPRSDWQLPQGVAYHFRAGEQLLVQTHFVNVGSLSTSGEGHVKINLNEAPAGSVQHYGGSLFGQDRDVLVPARSRTTLYADCEFPNPITLMAMTGHYHFRGRVFTTQRLAPDGTPGEEIYRHQGYDDPLFLTYDGPTAPRFEPGEGLRWSCTWDNPTDMDFEFGPFTDTNEHCNLFAFYYPAQGRSEATYCVREDGVDTTTVRSTE